MRPPRSACFAIRPRFSGRMRYRILLRTWVSCDANLDEVVAKQKGVKSATGGRSFPSALSISLSQSHSQHASPCALLCESCISASPFLHLRLSPLFYCTAIPVVFHVRKDTAIQHNKYCAREYKDKDEDACTAIPRERPGLARRLTLVYTVS